MSIKKNKKPVSKRLLAMGLFLSLLVVSLLVLSHIITSSLSLYQSKAKEILPKTKNTSGTYIYGGVEVTEVTQWPFMAKIYLPAGNGICSGTFIRPGWVLTAGHCVTVTGQDGKQRTFNESEMQSIWIRDGISFTPTTNRYTVKSIHRHENYGVPFPNSNDIALIELNQTIKNPDVIKTISLNTDTRLEQEKKTNGEYQNGVILGFGLIADNQQANSLFQGVLPLLSNLRVKKWNPNSDIINTEIASGYPLGGVDTCSGDSGGPILVWDNANWVQVGITSRGEGCALPHKPGISTRLSAYIGWIKGFINKPTPNCVACHSTDSVQGTFSGQPLAAEYLAEFNCRMNNVGTAPVGAQYKCGRELFMDDFSNFISKK